MSQKKSSTKTKCSGFNTRIETYTSSELLLGYVLPEVEGWNNVTKVAPIPVGVQTPLISLKKKQK